MLIATMLLAGVAAALGCWAAHQRMKDRTYHTHIPRYAVGVLCTLGPYALALPPAFTAPSLETVITLAIGPWYIFGMGGLFTWLAYEEDRPNPTEADARRFAPFIAGEHDDAPGRGD